MSAKLYIKQGLQLSGFCFLKKNVYPETACNKIMYLENPAKICENPHKISVCISKFLDSIQNHVSARPPLLKAAYLEAFFYHYHSILGSAFVGIFLNRHSMCRTFKPQVSVLFLKKFFKKVKKNLPLIEMSYRLSYLENFHFSNFQHPASEAANKFEK